MKNRILAIAACSLLGCSSLCASCAAPIPERVSAKESAANLRWFRKHYLDADLTDKLNTTQIVYNPLKSNHYATKPLWE